MLKKSSLCKLKWPKNESFYDSEVVIVSATDFRQETRRTGEKMTQAYCLFTVVVFLLGAAVVHGICLKTLLISSPIAT